MWRLGRKSERLESCQRLALGSLVPGLVSVMSVGIVVDRAAASTVAVAVAVAVVVGVEGRIGHGFERWAGLRLLDSLGTGAVARVAAREGSFAGGDPARNGWADHDEGLLDSRCKLLA